MTFLQISWCILKMSHHGCDILVERTGAVVFPHLSPRKFHWQTGYGVFSHSRSHRDHVIQYILNQEKHHKTQTFKGEYIGLLRKMVIEYDSRYLFDFLDV